LMPFLFLFPLGRKTSCWFDSFLARNEKKRWSRQSAVQKQNLK
jgi:hypothetical protein